MLPGITAHVRQGPCLLARKIMGLEPSLGEHRIYVFTLVTFRDLVIDHRHRESGPFPDWARSPRATHVTDEESRPATQTGRHAVGAS